MNFRWFFSRAARETSRRRSDARKLHKQVLNVLNAQRDLLSTAAVQNIQKSMDDLHAAVRSAAGNSVLQAKIEGLDGAANKWLKPYPKAGLREQVEVFLVAIAVAVGIRTFIAQPFKIPTGSMQPTLYGVTSVPDFQMHTGAGRFPSSLEPGRNFVIPGHLRRLFEFWFAGIGYDHVVAKSEGSMEATEDTPKKLLFFNLYQDFRVGGQPYRVWWPPDNLLKRAGLVDVLRRPNPHVFKPGENIIRMKSISGDHLFVDRIAFNFRRPKRGEIIVFETVNIPGMEQDPELQEQIGQFYIKRLVVLGGEKVRIGDDRHVVINDTNRLDRSAPGFERVYSFDPSHPASESKYSGHLNNQAWPGLAPRFPDERTPVEVPPRHYMVMGDNTVNSLDSRRWGWFPQENVIGRSWFVYWPMGRQEGRESRFGWGNR